MLDNLIRIMSKDVVLSKSDIDLCSTYFEPFVGSKNTILEEEGKLPQYLYFVRSGFIRLFYTDDNGDEVTTHFSAPDGFVASFLSFINLQKAKENVACVTECQLLRIARPNLQTLIDKSEKFKQFSLIIFQNAIAATEIRANDLATLNAEQRYKKFIEDQPLLLQNMPIQYIASYLGMKPESLSRIRRQMIN
jgi:CRP/FNR family transcriptional regulator, anaerobic regulatory protein